MTYKFDLICFAKDAVEDFKSVPLLSANNVMLLMSLWSKVRITFSISALPRP